MNVILLKDVADLGGKGDIVEVSNGYARNYLLPKNLAMKATTGAIKQAEKLRQQRIEAEARAKSDAEELARRRQRWSVRGSRTGASRCSLTMRGCTS